MPMDGNQRDFGGFRDIILAVAGMVLSAFTYFGGELALDHAGEAVVSTRAAATAMALTTLIVLRIVRRETRGGRAVAADSLTKTPQT